jgi:hypothetical protein
MRISADSKGIDLTVQSDDIVAVETTQRKTAA